MFFCKLFPRLVSYAFNKLTGDHVENVVVGISVAETGCGLQVAHPFHYLRAAEVTSRYEKIAFSQSQAASMHQQIANRHLARDPWIIHLKFWQVIDDLVVPIDLLLIDQNPEVGDRECLAGRSSRKNSVCIHWLRRAEFSHAITFC